jgi:FkbM family methyltransferase
MLKSFSHDALKFYIRRFPIAKGKVRLLSRVWKWFTVPPYVREAQVEGTSIRMRCDLTKFVQRHIYFFGHFEQADCANWMKAARYANTIFDVGANVGLYSLLAATVNPQSTIYAFEPTASIQGEFETNLQLNGIKNVQMEPFGVGATSASGFLHRSVGPTGDNEGTNYVTSGKLQDTDTEIRMVSLDDFCRQRGIEEIDLLKMDIEGGEYDALIGARDLLERKAIHCLFVELLERVAVPQGGHTTVEVKQILHDYGYFVYKVENGKAIPVPLEKIHTGNGDNVIAVADNATLEKWLYP